VADLNEKTILIVDDTPENVDILNELLSEYKRKVAINGEMALKVAEKTKPDLILLDVMMPGIDGFETAKRLKANPETSNIPIVFVTAKTDVNSFVAGFELGADDYIMKPFDHNIVVSVVKRKLELAD
jgi:putative two-component system response regulator